jgi:hypothetical protein
MLFNNHQELKFEQMKELTNIPESQILFHLKYFCNPKQKILEKDFPKIPEFKPDEKIRLFEGF